MNLFFEIDSAGAGRADAAEEDVDEVVHGGGVFVVGLEQRGEEIQRLFRREAELRFQKSTRNDRDGRGSWKTGDRISRERVRIILSSKDLGHTGVGVRSRDWCLGNAWRRGGMLLSRERERERRRSDAETREQFGRVHLSARLFLSSCLFFFFFSV